ncbi:MAG TPA: ABC-2 family transporter protein [Candidatus Acidoferrum sp.]|nr:ABC-2 family transporter protein [Candidatus Acidoferrum sp.]
MKEKLANFKRHLALLGSYFAQYAKVRVSYRGDFFISAATSMAATIFSLGFVLVLFTRVPKLANWRMEEVVFLYGFSLIPFGLFNVFSLNLYEFGATYIMEGKFDRVLLRPLSSLYQVVFEAFRIESLQEVVVGLFVMIWAARRMDYQWHFIDIVLLAFFAVCGGIIYISVFLFLSTFSFWFEDRIGIHPPFWNLLAFGRYPLSIYSGYVQFILSWIIPFGFATFYPATRLLGRPEFRVYAALVPVVTVAVFALAAVSWQYGLRRYSSTGS